MLDELPDVTGWAATIHRYETDGDEDGDEHRPYFAIDFGKVTDIRIQPEQKNLSRWYQEVSTRPSAKA